MIEIVIVVCLSLAASAVIILGRLHRARTFDEILSSVLQLRETTRAGVALAAGTVNWGPLPEQLRLREFLVFLWNSRLFIEMAHQIAVRGTCDEAKLVSEKIIVQHKTLRKFVFASLWERVGIRLLHLQRAHYEREAMAVYAESENLIFYLVSYWMPESEPLLGGKL